ncbi:MAG TPA: (Fe-S)-binding protein [Syntrophorhabdales bacterium]|nr:(Fe-S)-binding protein [Syntrophorhabdales bacterium]
MKATIAPFKEAIEMIKEAGGEAFRKCFQCGLCTASCPWNQVRTFLPHRLITESKFGLVELGEECWWLCSTCNMCVSRCPRGVSITDVIRAVRNITTDSLPRAVPESLRSAVASLKSAGNPWGGLRDERTNWSRDLAIPAMSKEKEMLYFSCCVPAFDPKMGSVARAAARLLKLTGADFGIIGTNESCCAESVRKAGNYELFDKLARSNIKAFKESGVKQIVTSSPHCYATFKNEYPALDGNFETIHFTQYLAAALNDGRLTPNKPFPRKVVYHDPCYLGRHSSIYDEPRQILRSIPGLTLLDEMNSRERSLCCGGGGARIWMETKKGQRFSDILVEQAVELGAEVLATACPYCILNFKDSVLTMGKENVLEVRDVCEIINEVI